MTSEASEAEVRAARGRDHLRAADPVLAALIDRRPDYDPRAWLAALPPMDLFGALMFQVAGQQLSVLATRKILGRIQDMFGGSLPSPAQLLSAGPERIRAAGLSGRKVATLRDLAERFRDGRIDAAELDSQPDEEIIAELTKIPGIGPWTVQGALIVALGREDVVLPGDLAFRKAVQAVYHLDQRPSPDEVVAIAEPWRPYRSLAMAYVFAGASDR
jgi:DNA-3-methyladenine glycosylase II